MEYLRGFAEAYTQGERDIADQTGQAATDSLERQMALPFNVPPSDKAALIPGSYGWYKRGNKIYRENGQTIDMEATLNRLQQKIRDMRVKGMNIRDIRHSLAWRRIQILRRYM
jgi:hypothetical protein